MFLALMIYQPTPNDPPFAGVKLASANGQRAVDLGAAGGVAELIGEIVRIANCGGGRVEVRLMPDDESKARGGAFSARIDAVGTKPEEVERARTLEATNLKPVRIVTDPSAPALQPQDVDRLYPWRQKDLLRELNGRLGRRTLNSYDIQAVRRQHHLDEHPDFVFNLPGAGRRYSPAAAEWIVDQYAADPEFFQRARVADHEIMKLRRRKPR
jgi:hypothetical protein